MGIALGTETVRFPFAALWPFLYLVIGGSVLGHTAALVLGKGCRACICFQLALCVAGDCHDPRGRDSKRIHYCSRHMGGRFGLCRSFFS